MDAERWFLYGSASAGHGGSLISVIFYLSLRMDQRINIEIYRITEQMQTSRARQLKSPLTPLSRLLKIKKPEASSSLFKATKHAQMPVTPGVCRLHNLPKNLPNKHKQYMCKPNKSGSVSNIPKHPLTALNNLLQRCWFLMVLGDSLLDWKI